MSQIVSTLNVLVMACIAVTFFVFATSSKPLPNDSPFAARIQASDIVLVKFGADWCPPCRKMEGELNHLAVISPHISIVKLDVQRDRELAAYYGISTIPHLILFKHGKQVDQIKGYRTHQELKSWIGTTN